MRYEFCRQSAHSFTGNFTLEDKERPSGKIDRDLCLTLVHGQQEAVAPDAAFAAEGLAQCVTERNRRVFYRVVLVHVEITVAGEVVPGSARYQVLRVTSARRAPGRRSCRMPGQVCSKGPPSS